MNLLKIGRMRCLFCVRITDSSHTSFPLTFVPVPISVDLKYPVPCCLCGFWGQSRCFCVGSWCLWWVILLSIYSISSSVHSHIQTIRPHILWNSSNDLFWWVCAWKIPVCIPLWQQQELPLAEYKWAWSICCTPWQLLWGIKLWGRANGLKYL